MCLENRTTELKCFFFFNTSCQRYLLLKSLIADNVNFYHLMEVVFVNFPHCKVLFIIQYYIHWKATIYILHIRGKELCFTFLRVEYLYVIYIYLKYYIYLKLFWMGDLAILMNIYFIILGLTKYYQIFLSILVLSTGCSFSWFYGPLINSSCLANARQALYH
jgi:hypothetical protein